MVVIGKILNIKFMKIICPQGHNKLETGFYIDGKCKICKIHRNLEWIKANPEKVREYHTKAMRNYRRTLRGFLDQKYTAMSKRVRGKDARCISTSKGLPIVPRNAFLEWAFKQKELITLFKDYKKSNWNFKVCPTIDRLDCSKGYIFGNMQFVTQSENSHRQKGRPKNWRTVK